MSHYTASAHQRVSVPLKIELQKQIIEDIETRFVPEMETLNNAIIANQDGFRKYLEQSGCLLEYKGNAIETPCMAIDAATASDEDSVTHCGIVIGVKYHTWADNPPDYLTHRITASVSETFTTAVSHMRVWAELQLLSEALDGAKIPILYDGSLSSLNFDLCKFVANMESGALEADETRQLLPLYEQCATDADATWFDIFDTHQAKKVIAVPKKSGSKIYTEGSGLFSSLVSPPSDKLMLDRVMRGDEYTTPKGYANIYRQSHGSNLPGYGDPAFKKESPAKRRGQKVLKTFSDLRVVYYRPWNWSPVFKLEYNARHWKLDDVLGVVKAHTAMRDILEPLPLYQVDLLTKQEAEAIKYYGSLNVGRFPTQYSAYRTAI